MIHLYIKQIINVCVYVCLYTHTYMLYLCVFKYDIYMKQIIHVLYIYIYAYTIGICASNAWNLKKNTVPFGRNVLFFWITNLGQCQSLLNYISLIQSSP